MRWSCGAWFLWSGAWSGEAPDRRGGPGHSRCDLLQYCGLDVADENVEVDVLDRQVSATRDGGAAVGDAVAVSRNRRRERRHLGRAQCAVTHEGGRRVVAVRRRG